MSNRHTKLYAYKGVLLRDVGLYLRDQGYRIIVLNLVKMYESDGYNPFHYIRSDEDEDINKFTDCPLRIGRDCGTILYE